MDTTLTVSALAAIAAAGGIGWSVAASEREQKRRASLIPVRVRSRRRR